MGDLHQYEIHYRWTDNNFHGTPMEQKIALEWAYSVQEAFFQLELRLKQQSSSVSRFHIETAGPVTKAVNDRDRTHYHVCPKCRKVFFCGGCRELERSDLTCADCLSEEPHVHYCGICKAERACADLPCGFYNTRDICCRSHLPEELKFFFEMMEGKKSTP